MSVYIFICDYDFVRVLTATNRDVKSYSIDLVIPLWKIDDEQRVWVDAPHVNHLLQPYLSSVSAIAFTESFTENAPYLPHQLFGKNNMDKFILVPTKSAYDNVHHKLTDIIAATRTYLTQDKIHEKIEALRAEIERLESLLKNCAKYKKIC